jgi:hypothetical protein
MEGHEEGHGFESDSIYTHSSYTPGSSRSDCFLACPRFCTWAALPACVRFLHQRSSHMTKTGHAPQIPSLLPLCQRKKLHRYVLIFRGLSNAQLTENQSVDVGLVYLARALLTKTTMIEATRQQHSPVAFRVRTRAWAGSRRKASFLHGFAAAAKYAR